MKEVKQFKTEKYNGYIFNKKNIEGDYIYLTFSYGIEVEIHIIKNVLKTIKIMNSEILYGHGFNVQSKVFDEGKINFNYINLIKDVFDFLSEEKDNLNYTCKQCI